MLGILKALIALPIAIAVVLLAVANRAPVTLSFDPFTRGGPPEISATLPLFVVLFAAVGIGILAGGVGAWLTGGKHRRARRMSSREIARLKLEAERLRTNVAARAVPAGPGLPAPVRPV